MLGLNTAKIYSDAYMQSFHDLKTKYFLSENSQSVQLQESLRERDIGVLVSADLKPSAQCEAAAENARSILGMIHRQFKRLKKQDFLLIYMTYVRPHLEYCIQAYSP